MKTRRLVGRCFWPKAFQSIERTWFEYAGPIYILANIVGQECPLVCVQYSYVTLYINMCMDFFFRFWYVNVNRYGIRNESDSVCVCVLYVCPYIVCRLVMMVVVVNTRSSAEVQNWNVKWLKKMNKIKTV